MSASQPPSPSVPPLGPTGLFSATWVRFFASLVQAPAKLQSIRLTASPFTYTADDAGFVSVRGGTVTLVTLNRAQTTVAVGGQFIPVSPGDVLSLTYSAAPTLTFIPS